MDMGQMGWTGWLVIGVAAGWLANRVKKTNLQNGLFIDMFLGVVGALIGGFLFNQIETVSVTGLDIWGIFIAFSGALVLLVALRILDGRLRI